MIIKQLSVFIENSAGKLCEITRLLANENINLIALNIAETTDYGVLRLITDNTDKAEGVVKEHGFIAHISEVYAVAVPNRAGGLNILLELAEKYKINIEYMYSALGIKNNKAYLIIKTKNLEKFEKLLLESGIEIASQSELLDNQ